MATGSMSKGPGKSYREGLSLDRLFRMFPTDEAAEAWFTAERWPEWAVLPALRLSQYPVRHRASDHDASVPRLPEAAHVLAQDRDGDAGLAARLSNMARRDLPGGDEPQGGFVDEAPPRPGHRPEVRVVSRTPHSRGVEGGRRSVRRSPCSYEAVRSA